ncbi:MAG: YicC family protein [Prevotellaceae bacterium]|nr:YicC family protein [Candidatus Minthosoma equi]
MIQSMTGYGKCVVEFNGKKIHAEVKSLNSKALDLSTRLATVYREKEMEIRQLIQQTLERGKVDFNLWVEKNEASQSASINMPLALEYFRQMKELGDTLGFASLQNSSYGSNSAADWMSVILRMPDVMSRTEVEELTDEEWIEARKAVEGALAEIVAFRKQEGLALAEKFKQNISNIAALLESIEPYEKGRTEKIRQRLIETLENNIGVDYDKNRLEQEMIYYIEKLDINEEKQRLTNHLSYFIETMEEGHGQGKKLGFIAQEMGREINTTGSKSNQAEMQNIVVKMKDELEQIKEQVLNVM